MASQINKDHFRLMLITQGESLIEIEHEVGEYLKAGGKWVQLRMKDKPTTEVEFAADKISKLCNLYDATFIINDFSYLVMNQLIDGVHLGKNDMSIIEARSLLGPNKIIGATANSLDDIHAHIAQGADYVGLGPFRFTTTKKNLSPTLGLNSYVIIIEMLKRLHNYIPIVAIGGIGLEDVDDLMGAGVDGVAVSGAICRAKDKQFATASFLKQISFSLHNINNQIPNDYANFNHCR